MRYLVFLCIIVFNSCSKSSKNSSQGNGSDIFNYRGQFQGYIKLNDSTDINDGFIYGSISEFYVDVNKISLEGRILMIYNQNKDTLINDDILQGYIINDSIFMKIVKTSDTLELKGRMTYENHYEGEWFLFSKVIKGQGNFWLEKPEPIDTFFFIFAPLSY